MVEFKLPEMEKESIKNAAKIVVVGVGGAGNNAINRMIEDEILSVTFIAANSDAQALRRVSSPAQVIQLGETLTKGLGCGADPEMGKRAGKESEEAIKEMLKGSDMVFVTCGMGGGTGTGAAPIIASIAKEQDILTIGIVTKPFSFEGKKRMKNADEGIRELKECVDTIVVIPNDKLLHMVESNTSTSEAFKKADEVLRDAVRGITDLIVRPALINLDFADVKTVMKGKKTAHIGMGRGTGENRVKEALKAAVTSELLDTSITTAKDMILLFRGDLSLIDVDAAMKMIQEQASDEVNVIFGVAEDDDMAGQVEVTVIATGMRDTSLDSSGIDNRSFSPENLGFNINQQNQGSIRFVEKKPLFDTNQVPFQNSSQIDQNANMKNNQNINPFIPNFGYSNESGFASDIFPKNNIENNNTSNVDKTQLGLFANKKKRDDKPSIPGFLSENFNSKNER
ncbi:MAG: cell division protein FtsZ [Eubacteriales bacterium]|nr:cell division protein FtsZ [Eubacteriales bacterium]